MYIFLNAPSATPRSPVRSRWFVPIWELEIVSTAQPSTTLTKGTEFVSKIASPHPLNAPAAMLVTLDGMETDDNDIHL